MRNQRNKQVKKKLCMKFGHCLFCGSNSDEPVRYGKLFIRKSVTVHYFCALFASGLAQNGKLSTGVQGFLIKDILEEVKRGKQLKCIYCKRNGATIGCVNVRCRKAFHLRCGQENGALTQFYGSFKSFCKQHKPKQVIRGFSHKKIYTCCICLDTMNCGDSCNVLKCPCCASGWFHRSCIQQYAYSSGYFFKCPLCNNVDIFSKEMLQYGIYVPKQDASWEQVDNAFEELLTRPECNAESCLCPSGRSRDKKHTIWLLRICLDCGGKAMHVGCDQSSQCHSKTWHCSECVTTLKKIRERTTTLLHPNVKTRSNTSDLAENMEEGSETMNTESSLSQFIWLDDFRSSTMVSPFNVGHLNNPTKFKDKTEEHVMLFEDNTDELIDVCELGSQLNEKEFENTNATKTQYTDFEAEHIDVCT